MKTRFDYLHDKLSHIKRLILEYETAMAAVSNNGAINATSTSTTNIGDVNSRHYWHKLKRPSLVPHLFLFVVGTLLSTLSQNLHFLGKFQGWSFTVHIWFLGSIAEKVKWFHSDLSRVRYLNLHYNIMKKMHIYIYVSYMRFVLILPLVEVDDRLRRFHTISLAIVITVDQAKPVR